MAANNVNAPLIRTNKTDMENLLSDNWRSRTVGSVAHAIDAFFAKRLATAGNGN